MDEQNSFGTVARTEEMENRLAKMEKIKAGGVIPEPSVSPDPRASADYGEL